LYEVEASFSRKGSIGITVSFAFGNLPKSVGSLADIWST
jgi:hypothetical protein